ncbi:hypothetical protein FF098_015125 [Parvularcula flava]|uniref:Peptidase M56 domain-containing protein n=1 Tax=Aquisalinus luteolus TaxID=1566827 RepID=A0A8J3A405_9PROT|nr:M56 family metallopeptidase [Aquisalinus luteolus]NHK29249.1 hypothetical protein [Aquisalinus luteolus]GGI01349.1 hypothetical protein GCM10011355_31780 [Aquisalinus luteolus]
MAVVLFLLVAFVWSGLVRAAVDLHQTLSRDTAPYLSWPAYWLAAIVACVLPPVFLVLMVIFPSLKPAFLDGLSLLSAEAALAGEAMPQPAPGASPYMIDPALAGSSSTGAEQQGFDLMAFLVSAFRTVLPVVAPVLAVIYAGGIVFLGLRFAIGRSRVGAIVNRARPEPLLRGNAPVLITDEAMTPFARGGFRPVIILPSCLTDEMDGDRLNGIIAHEGAHIARRDPEWSMGLSVLTILFWVSPFLKSLVDDWRLSAELACDAAALAGASSATRRAYAQSLIDALRIPSQHGGHSGALPCPLAAFSTTELKDEKMRLSRILKTSSVKAIGLREKLTLGAAAMALALAGCAGAATMTADNAPEAPTRLSAPAVPTEMTAPVEPTEPTRLAMVEPTAPPALALDGVETDIAMVNNMEQDGLFQQVITYEDGTRLVRDWDDLSEEEKAAIREDMAQAEEDLAQARIDIEEARVEIEMAREEVARELAEIERDHELTAEERLEIQQEVERELARAQEEIERARAEIEREVTEMRKQQEKLQDDQ